MSYLISKECEGCRSNGGTYCKLGIVPCITGTKGCPCRNCLVKAMCSHLCDDFLDYKCESRNVKDFDTVLREFDHRGVSYHGTYDRKRLMS